MIRNIASVYDEFLGISTEMEENDSQPNRSIYIRYVPTDYMFIEKLFNKYPFDENDHFVDFGCGKGRVLIMSAYYSCKHITGYELSEDRYKILQMNVKNFQVKFNNTSIFSLFKCNVENVVIDDTANKFFFYEPFHLKVYIRVMKAIQNSLQRNKRNIYFFLYKPFESTVKYMDSFNRFKKIDILDDNSQSYLYHLHFE